MDTDLIALNAGSNITLYHRGPPLDLGPLPTLFYFALSGPDSLLLDPFNQPVQFLRGQMIRIFSLTLPAHENGLPPTDALRVWADDFSKGIDPLEPFLNECSEALSFAIREKFVDPKRIGAAGLSRGGLIAFHLAARDERFRSLVAFAPITRLHEAKEFAPMQKNGAVRSYDAEALSARLADRRIRLYIGNRDTRVGTRSCFEFAMALVDKAQRSSPNIELIITPSMGRDGHGTTPETFREGAHWIASSL